MTGWLLSDEQRAGLLVAVISGGRPLLEQRPTGRFLSAFDGSGFSGPSWVVSSRDAPRYETDRHPVEVYTHAWAYDYAREHWMNTEPPTPDGFLGGFPAREWINREAERRGCWGVLQLDDNITDLKFLRGTTSSTTVVDDAGGLAFYADVLGALALATNAAMLGAQLNAVIPSAKDSAVLVRPGFPYSCFVEKVAGGGEPWLGPFEEDITHAFQYDRRPDGVTAAVTPLLTYRKEHKSKTGMRAAYDQTRSVQLQRLLPQGATLGIRATRANGKGDPRVFHKMTAGAIRNPLVVRDRPLYDRVRARVEEVRRAWYALEVEANRAKVRKRTERYAAKTAGGPT